ncbi:MAG: hypothetical protein LKF81_01855 [Prevotella sp.]|nr:hypothetical protein [Prevotella sp.]
MKIECHLTYYLILGEVKSGLLNTSDLSKTHYCYVVASLPQRSYYGV